MKKVLSMALAAALLLAGLAGCSRGGGQKQADLSAFAKSLQEKYEFAAYLSEMTPEYPYFEEDMNNYMPGLLELDLEQRVIYMSMVTLNNGEFALAQAKNSGDAAKVRDAFQHRIDYDGETPGGAFYPGPTELWTNYSRVVANGNYVMLVCAEECDQIAEEFNALFA